MFSDPVARLSQFPAARPGEVGDRNVLRGQGYISLDMGLYKSFKLPWKDMDCSSAGKYSTSQTRRFDNATIADLSLGTDPFLEAIRPRTSVVTPQLSSSE